MTLFCIKNYKAKTFKHIFAACRSKMDFTVIFIVALGMYIQNNTQLFVPFDRAALLLTNSTVIDKKASDQEINLVSGLRWRELENFKHPDAPVLLTIEQKTYDEYYGGTAPIDRCKIADAIQPVLSADPKALFLDFDLSPLQNPDKEFRACQDKLDRLLYENSTRLVLIEPFNQTNIASRWKDKLQKNGLVFATAKMNASLGLVLTSSASTNSVARTLHNKVYNCTENLCGDENIQNTSPINYAGLGS